MMEVISFWVIISAIVVPLPFVGLKCLVHYVFQKIGNDHGYRHVPDSLRNLDSLMDDAVANMPFFVTATASFFTNFIMIIKALVDTYDHERFSSFTDAYLHNLVTIGEGLGGFVWFISVPAAIGVLVVVLTNLYSKYLGFEIKLKKMERK